jgi:hypothetical protein
MVHGTAQRWLYDYYCRHADEGLVVWFVSLIKYQNTCLLPSIDARLQIDRVVTETDSTGESPYIQRVLKKYPYVFIASTDTKKSYFLPWYNALSLLHELTFQGNHPTLVWADADLFDYKELSLFNDKPSYSQIPLFLQSSRKLTSEAAQQMERYSYYVQSLPLAFISYRWREATPLTLLLTEHLSMCKVAVWWDRWSMPRRVGGNLENIEGESLSAFLFKVLAKARYGIALRTQTYDTATSPFTQAEYQYMTQLAERGSFMLIDIPAKGSLSPSISRLSDLEAGKRIIQNLSDHTKEQYLW